MIRMFRAALAGAAVVALAAGAGAASDEKLGAGVTLGEATSIKTLHEHAEHLLGQTVRVDGVVTAVCEAAGCWMALAHPDHPDLTVRFKVDHDAGIVFPLAAKGRMASAQGVLERIPDGDAGSGQAAGEHAGAHKPAPNHGQIPHPPAAGQHGTTAHQPAAAGQHEHGAATKASEFNAKYQIKATGALIK